MTGEPRVTLFQWIRAFRRCFSLFVCLMLVWLASGCETRDRSNPFDPENPETEGQPRVLNAIAGDESVVLRWDLKGLDDPLGLRLLREVAGVRSLLLEEDEVMSGEFLDSSLPNDVEVRYHLEVQSPDGTWLSTVPDTATPGATRAWVGDAIGGGLTRLAPDGRDVLREVSFGDFLDMEVELDGTVWAPNWSQGEILELDREGEILQRFEHRGGNTIAIDRVTGQIWIGSFGAGALSRYDREGKQLWHFGKAGPVEDVAPARGKEGGIWAAIRFSGILRIFNDGIQDRWDQFNWPVSISEDEGGHLWVVDRATQKISKILVSTTGEVLESPAVFADPVDGTPDGEGGYWVADPGRRGLVHLDAEAREVEFLAVGKVTGVTFDPRSERLWIVLREEGRVATLNLAGEELSSVTVGGSPVRVEGNWP